MPTCTRMSRAIGPHCSRENQNGIGAMNGVLLQKLPALPGLVAICSRAAPERVPPRKRIVRHKPVCVVRQTKVRHSAGSPAIPPASHGKARDACFPFSVLHPPSLFVLINNIAFTRVTGVAG